MRLYLYFLCLLFLAPMSRAQQAFWTLYFETASAQSPVDGLPQALHPDSMKGNLVVVGYTDPAGNVASNKALGLARAKFLKAQLLALGWPSDRVLVESRGEQHEFWALSYPLQRKAEVLFVPTVSSPKPGCRAHFSGAILGNRVVEGHISKIYDLQDPAGEMVGAGRYPDNTQAFPKAVATTFDAIAVDEGTSVILYAEPNFGGAPVAQLQGPAVLVNTLWFGDQRYLNSGLAPDSLLDALFPAEVRSFSSDNMHLWSNGSVIVQCKD